MGFSPERPCVRIQTILVQKNYLPPTLITVNAIRGTTLSLTSSEVFSELLTEASHEQETRQLSTGREVLDYTHILPPADILPLCFHK